MGVTFDFVYASWVSLEATISSIMSSIAGHRAQRWLVRRCPSLGCRIWRDAGAWLGLVLGLAMVLAINARGLESFACSLRASQICLESDAALSRKSAFQSSH